MNQNKQDNIRKLGRSWSWNSKLTQDFVTWKLLALVCTAWCLYSSLLMSWHSREATVMNCIYKRVKWDRKGRMAETQWDLEPGPPGSRTLSKVTRHCTACQVGKRARGRRTRRRGWSAGHCTRRKGAGFYSEVTKQPLQGLSRAIYDWSINVCKRFVHLYT